ncbi:site-2 protease family protein [Candidatus Woesearchaeota archaeon]|nr:site-2 protease family protein [Candidatus Woesearchaeota archaeon]
MDVQSILAIIFVIVLTLFLYLKRDKLVIQKILWPVFYFLMYRTKLGLKWMDIIANRFGRAIRFVSIFGVIIGFIGMAFISFELISATITLFLRPEAPASIKPVLPFQAKGVFFVPFLYWITSIFFIAVIHEFSHGVVARAFKIPVKSSGFAFFGILLPIIPAAFVEPDEKKLSKHKAKEQLAVFAAGPFSNILAAGILFILVILLINPAAESLLQLTGTKATTITQGGPAEQAGMQAGELITAINGQPTTTVQNFTKILSELKPRTTITVTTNATTRTLTLTPHPTNATKAYIGLSVSQGTEIKQKFKQQYGEKTTAVIVWFFGLIYWLLLLNLGIGMFNLLPIGPVDGGRMLLLALQKWNPTKGVFAWKIISMIFMFLILANIAVGFIK